MQLTISIPGNVPIAVISAALAQFGGVVKVKQTRQAEPKQAPDFEPVIVRHKETGEEVREIDGVSAQKAIAKIMAEVRRGQNAAVRHFPRVIWTDNPEEDTQGYIRSFCNMNHHKPAEYVNGLTA